MLFRPEGLFPSRQRKAELHAAQLDARSQRKSRACTRRPCIERILAIKRLTQRFGGLVAVKELDFEVEAGSIVAMIGPNGAGKSTVFNLITGIYKPSEGQIEFNGSQIQGRSTSAIAALGIARTFQNIRLFAFMSALDNVMTGRHARMHATLADSLLNTPRARKEEDSRSRARP